MSKQVTEWMGKGESYCPVQVLTENDADKFGWGWWEKRTKKTNYIKNMEWIKSERLRMKQKGIKVELRERTTLKGVQIAIFSK
tara:strand:- start:1030 stop:1278 length:249 start_codon:yes stop_codon:yes gene_type:complete